MSDTRYITHTRTGRRRKCRWQVADEGWRAITCSRPVEYTVEKTVTRKDGTIYSFTTAHCGLHEPDATRTYRNGFGYECGPAVPVEDGKS